MFSETQISIDVQELCSKYNLNHSEYFKIKQIVMQGAVIPEPDPGFATLFFMESGYCNFEKCSHLVIEEIKKTDKFHLVRHGDILFNTAFNDQEEYDGMYFFVKVEDGASTRDALKSETGDFVLVKSVNNMIPRVFKTIEDFPEEYWEDPVEVIISGNRVHFYAINSDMIPVSESIEKRIQPMTQKSINLILRHDPDFFDDDIPEVAFNHCLLYNKMFRYKNKVYVFSSRQLTPPGYITFDDVFYSNEVPSRWGIVRAFVWLLVLHQKAVVTAIHPLRKLERKEFEI